MKKMVFTFILSAVLFAGCGSGEPRGTTPGNAVNRGLICLYGEWVYYASAFDEWKIYKMPYGGGKSVKINDLPASSLNIKGDWLYYGSELWDNAATGIHRMSLDGKVSQKLTMDKPQNIIVDGEWIYYINISDEYKIYKITTDGTQRAAITKESCWQLNLKGKYLYYATAGEGEFFRLKTDGSEKAKVFEDRVRTFNVVGDQVYYANVNDGGKLYRAGVDGTNKVKLGDEEVGSLNVDKGWIYYIVDNHNNPTYSLYKIKTDGRGKTKLTDWVADINIAGEWIYYLTFQPGGSGIARVQKDGTGKELIEDLLFRQRSAPQEAVLNPVDDAVKNKEFYSFKERLLKAVEQKDVAFFKKQVDPNILFEVDLEGGEKHGLNQFLSRWQLNSNPVQSDLWALFEDVIRLGVVNTNRNEFKAPYTDVLFPYEGYENVMDFQIIIDKETLLHEKPDQNSKVLEKLSYNIVRVLHEEISPKGKKYGWVKVLASSHNAGWVYGENIRPAHGFTAVFKKKSGAWKLTHFYDIPL